MNTKSLIQLSIATLIAISPFLGRNSGACSEGSPGVITNAAGQVLFISENATDKGETLQDAVDAGANLQGASLKGITLRDIRLHGADLAGADFRGAVLEDVDFAGANLRKVNFEGAQFKHVSYRKANLQGAKLAGIIYG